MYTWKESSHVLKWHCFVYGLDNIQLVLAELLVKPGQHDSLVLQSSHTELRLYLCDYQTGLEHFIKCKSIINKQIMQLTKEVVSVSANHIVLPSRLSYLVFNRHFFRVYNEDPCKHTLNVDYLHNRKTKMFLKYVKWIQIHLYRKITMTYKANTKLIKYTNA